MIEKLSEIHNVGRFKDCVPRGDVSFRKLTLLFAENGRGKTTLCAILRSLQTGRPEFISERKTLGATTPTLIQMRISGNPVAFRRNAWTNSLPNIEIFDSVFIHDNVYAGDYVDHDHKKNLYRVIVGTQGARLAKTVDDLDGKIKDISADIRGKKDAIASTLPNGVTLDSYLALQPVPDIDDRIQEKSNEIENRQRTLGKATEIANKSFLAKLTLPTLPSDFRIILAKKLEDVAVDSEAKVQQQIRIHNMGNHGEAWLSQGLGFEANDNCPFCGQNTNENDLIAAYRSHFSAAYNALKLEVFGLSQRITNSIGESALGITQQTILNNLALVEFWQQFAAITLPDIVVDDIRTKFATLRELALAAAQRKQQTPLEAISLNEEFSLALREITAIDESLSAYNSAVELCNTLIREQKTQAQQSGVIDVLKRDMAELEAKKKRHEPTSVQMCQAYQNAQTSKISLETQKAAAREQLDQYCLTILATYEAAINVYLDQFSAGFKIVNTQHSYRGGSPSSQFQIQINNTSIDLGDERTPSGTPCFKTTLSSGDRSALALAFFLAALKQDPELSGKIVVLDDPFTSLDRFRRTCTQQLIRQFASLAAQVIVLSHDSHFLRLIWEGYHPPSEIKVLQLFCAGSSTIIGEWDIDAETQSVYVKNHSTLLDFFRERRGEPLAVARAIRPFIEGMLRVHFPGHFQPNEWLGTFLTKIRNAGPSSALQHAMVDLPELEAINDYSKKYHHEQNANADSEHISPDELHAFVKRTLRLIGGCQ